MCIRDRIDLGFYWEVKPIAKNMSRKDFADSALTSRMKIRTTNTNILDLKESVEKALISYEKDKPINLYSEILEKITPQVLKSLKSELNPDKFENLVKFYFEKNGATDVYIPAKNEKGKEGDADVVAIFELFPYDAGIVSDNSVLAADCCDREPLSVPQQDIHLITTESGEAIGPGSLGQIIFTAILDSGQ